MDNNEFDDIHKAIIKLREKGKENPNLDFNRELRKIQDKISDAKGEERRPITAAVPQQSKKKKKSVTMQEDEDESEEEEVEEEEDSNEEEEEEEEDPDKEIKDMINKRLTTCMLLALSFERDDDYPKDFYEKLAESKKYKEVVKPFKASEIKVLNKLLKERKKQAKKRLDECK